MAKGCPKQAAAWDFCCRWLACQGAACWQHLPDVPRCSLHHQSISLVLCNPPADLAGSNKVVLPNNVETMQSSAITVLSLEEGDVHQVCC